MAAVSAALCLWRTASTSGSDGAAFEVLIVHPGGPFWASKDEGAWSFPKGEFDPDAEEALEAARREFGEELGVVAPEGEYLDLGQIRQKAGKVVRAWAVSGNIDTTTISSNTFEIEWPPRSGRRQEFPEVDRAEWCSPELAKRRLNPAQAEFVDRLDTMLSEPS